MNVRTSSAAPLHGSSRRRLRAGTRTEGSCQCVKLVHVYSAAPSAWPHDCVRCRLAKGGAQGRDPAAGTLEPIRHLGDSCCALSFSRPSNKRGRSCFPAGRPHVLIAHMCCWQHKGGGGAWALPQGPSMLPPSAACHHLAGIMTCMCAVFSCSIAEACWVMRRKSNVCQSACLLQLTQHLGPVRCPLPRGCPDQPRIWMSSMC